MKNHLFIGLGGQGGKSIAELKRVFERRESDARTLTERGQKWDFLYIDSSKDVTNNRANWTHFGKNIQLDPDSFLYLKDGGEKLNPSALQLRPDINPWLGNVSTLDKFLEGTQGIQGANQRRRFGRLLFANNADRIRKAVCEDKITPMLPNGNQCAIHIFASLAGGTGSGSIIDLVTMLRNEFTSASVNEGFPIFLYLYVTSDDFEDAQVGYFHQNQYATLRDLNALACGRFKPHLLGSARGGQNFSGSEAITQIALSTSLSGRNQRISLPKQHKIVAESAFERIYSYCSGNLNEDEQKPLTGEDRLVSYPGEPVSGMLRSFRFGSTGMRIWELPTAQIKELLANELYVSIFNRILYQNWDSGVGSLDKKLLPSNSGESALVQTLISKYQESMVERLKLGSLSQSVTDDFTRTIEGLKKKGLKNLDLEGVELRLRERYTNNLNDVGVDAVFGEYSNSRSSRLEVLIKSLQTTIRDFWTRSIDPLGFAYIPSVILALQESIRTSLENTQKIAGSSDNGALTKKMTDRKEEWRKLTMLFHHFKAGELVTSHRNDLLKLLNSELRTRVQAEDHSMLDQLSAALSKLSGDYQQAISRIEGWRNEKAKRSNELRRSLSQLHGADTSNRYELSDEHVESYFSALKTEEQRLRSTADELLQEHILPIIKSKSIESLGHLEAEQELRLIAKNNCRNLRQKTGTAV